MKKMDSKKKKINTEKTPKEYDIDNDSNYESYCLLYVEYDNKRMLI